MTIEKLASRFSNHSGYAVVGRRLGGVLEFRGAAANGTGHTLTVTRGFGRGHLREVCGRLAHWAVTPEEQQLMWELLG